MCNGLAANIRCEMCNAEQLRCRTLIVPNGGVSIMKMFPFLFLLFISTKLFSQDLVCERVQTAVVIEVIQYSVCLLREENKVNRYVGIRYTRKNVSDKNIRLFVRDLKSPWRYEISLVHGGNDVFSDSEKIYDDDMRISINPDSSLVALAPTEVIEGDLFFSEIQSKIRKEYSKTNFKGEFSVGFSLMPSFLYEKEELSELDAWRKRDKERVEFRSTDLAGYSDILIDWRYSKQK